MTSQSRKIFEAQLSKILRKISLADFRDKNYVSLSMDSYTVDTKPGVQLPSVKVDDWMEFEEVFGSYTQGRASRQFIKTELADAFQRWNLDYPPSNDEIQQVVNEIMQLLDELCLESFRLFIPLSGINYLATQKLPLARCSLVSGHERSQMAATIRTLQRRNKGREVTDIPLNAPFLRATVYGDFRTFDSQGTLEAEDALAVLRILCVSRVVGHYKSYPRTMHSPGTTSRSVFWHKVGRKTYVGQSEGIVEGLGELTLSDQDATLLSERGLAKYNKIFMINSPGIQRRKSRAIRSFNLGITALSDRDAFISYVIAIESLLSTGRQSKETLGQWVAALLTQSTIFTVGTDTYTLRPLISREFGNILRDQPLQIRQILVANRFVELYKLRNKLIHAGQESDIVLFHHMIDIEFLARSLIAAIVTGPWKNEDALMKWLSSEIESMATLSAVKPITAEDVERMENV